MLSIFCSSLRADKEVLLFEKSTFATSGKLSFIQTDNMKTIFASVDEEYKKIETRSYFSEKCA